MCFIGNMIKIEKTDVAIIGAGPVGLFAVFACGMLKLRAHVIDALEDIGGQCSALYPEKPIYDIPGYPQIAAAELIANLEAQTAPFGPVYHLDQTVNRLEAVGDEWLLETSKGVRVQARAVIIAAGAGAFGPNRPPLDGLAEYEGKSVFYMVRRKADFKGKRVVIAGGGDSAIDWALSLMDVAERVALIHRREKFRAAPDNVAKIHDMAAQGALDLIVPFQLKGLEGANGRLSGVHVESLEGGAQTIPADILLPFYGLAASLGPLAEWDLALDGHHIVTDQGTAATNLPGIYAVGDITTYEHKLKLILTGFAEAEQAAHAIYKRLYPDTAPHFEYSTSKGVPGA